MTYEKRRVKKGAGSPGAYEIRLARCGSSEKTKLQGIWGIPALLTLRHRWTSPEIPPVPRGSSCRACRLLVRSRRSIPFGHNGRHLVLSFFHKNHLILGSHVDPDEVPEL